MIAPVDVLTVMDRDAGHAAAYRLAHGYADGDLMGPINESAAAHAAVVELIEATAEIVERGTDSPQHNRVMAALARIGGAK